MFTNNENHANSFSGDNENTVDLFRFNQDNSTKPKTTQASNVDLFRFNQDNSTKPKTTQASNVFGIPRFGQDSAAKPKTTQACNVFGIPTFGQDSSTKPKTNQASNGFRIPTFNQSSSTKPKTTQPSNVVNGSFNAVNVFDSTIKPSEFWFGGSNSGVSPFTESSSIIPVTTQASNGVSLNSEDSSTKLKTSQESNDLYLAVCSNKIEQVKELLSLDSSANSMYCSEINTSLIEASERGYLEIAKFLINNGAEVNFRNVNGSTPLHLAAANDDVHMCALLLRQGADIQLKNSVGCDSLHLAASVGSVGVSELLILYGSDIGRKNNDGKTCFDIAKHFMNEKLIALFERSHNSQSHIHFPGINHSSRLCNESEYEGIEKKVKSMEKELMRLKLLKKIVSHKDSIARLEKTKKEVEEIDKSIIRNERNIQNHEKKLQSYRESLRKLKDRKKSLDNDLTHYDKLKCELNFLEERLKQDNFEEDCDEDLVNDINTSCPVCYTKMTPDTRIYQCLEGHYFCSSCHDNYLLKTCPQCLSSRNTFIRARGVEDMISRIYSKNDDSIF